MPALPPHRHRGKLLAAAVTVTAAAVFVAGPPAPLGASPPAPSGPGAPRSGPARTVTLVTGDVVHLLDAGAGRQAVEVERPAGATGGVRTETIGGDLYVLPDEAMRYLAAGELDRRLFDVSSLIRQGYDDQHSDGIPVILGYADGATAARSARTVSPGLTAPRALPSINGRATRVDKRNARRVWASLTAPTAGPAGAAPLSVGTKPLLADGLREVWLDGKVHTDLAESTAQIGAPAAWAAGFDGTGVKVAVLDTGADLNHPDLAGRVSTAVSFVPGEGVADGNGHGTHTLSTVGGSGAASGGAERGVAPGADLIVGKVLSDEGFGDDSWIIAGMEWAAGQGARVISMSLGGSDPSDGTDPMSQAVDRLSAQTGTLFVIAAGNTGSEASISSPGAAGAALTVAAVDSSDQLAWFSSMGPRFADYALKPDIAAPGVDILAALAGGTAATGYYQTMSGTSMATPHVAGAAAILAQEHPGWTGAQLKDALMSTARVLPGTTAYQVGAGRVDVAAAVADPVTATGSAYFGFDAWPHGGEPPVQRSVTYTNSGASAVTLHLNETAAVAGGPYDTDPAADAGTPAPDGMFTLSAATVTVPAHSTASVTATARPALGADGRRYLGTIVATDDGGATVAHTVVGLYREDRRFTLHLSIRDRSGRPAAGLVELQRFGQVDPMIEAVDDSGALDLRLPGGAYSLLTYLDTPGTHGPDSEGIALLGDPQIDLDRDRTVTLDARQAVEVTARAPTGRPLEDRALYLDWYRSDGGDSVISEQYLLPSRYDTMYALPTAHTTVGQFEFEARWRKAYPLLTVADHGRPVAFLGQAGSSLYRGTSVLPTVYAGAGDTADYAGIDASGKAVIVTRSDALTGTQRAQNAAAAGARLLIEVNDGPGKLSDYVGADDGGDSPVPVISVTAATGATLIARAGQPSHALHVTGTPDSPYVYDLAAPYPGRIPTTLAYRPGAGDLATVRMRFGGTTPMPGGEFRWDYRPYRQFASGFWLKQGMPAVRTDYVSAQPGDAWAESAVTGPGLTLVSVADVHTYRAGAAVTSDWFLPVTRPRDGGGFWSSQRDSLSVQFNVQPWADGGAGHAGYLAGGDSLTFRVYQGGKLLTESDDWASASLYPVPARTMTYTLDLRADRDPAVWRLSPRTHTVWRVVSPAVTDPTEVDLMPLLQLDYRVDTDLAGNAPGGRQTLGLAASHLPGVVGGGKIVGGSLAVSFDDGQTWRSVALSGGTVGAAGSWVGGFAAPAHGFVSIRASAWDARGNRVTQTITRAYGLR